MAQLDELFIEIADVLRQHQPELKATLLPDRVFVAGTFVCMSDAGPFDRFEIEIALSTLFPQTEPQVHEVGGRIPRTVSRHVFPSSGCCCLGLWEGWLLKMKAPTFADYLSGPVTSYFISQSLFETTGDWPFGEQGHSVEAIMATYAEAIDLPAGADRSGYLRLLTSAALEGNPNCPCGSGKRLRDCHWRSIREHRQRISAFVRNEMAHRLKGAEKKFSRAREDRPERTPARRIYPVGQRKK